MKVVLLDIEGTVCPIDFVHRTLFPYARERIPAWVSAHPDDPAVVEVAREGGEVAATLVQWIDQDRKVTPLKAIQGRIWRDGFTSGALVAPMYPDVRPALEAWLAAGARLAVYSSGSVEAQQLLFRYSSAGDLAPLISAWFDTTTGPKRVPASYQGIAAALGVAPRDVLFCSDIAEGLAAADVAGMCGCLLERDGPAGGADTPWSRSPRLPRP